MMTGVLGYLSHCIDALVVYDIYNIVADGRRR